MTDIATERSQARDALAAAERSMKEQSADPDAFRRAKSARVAALEALERLDWAERHQAEQAEAEALRKRHRELEEAQQRAEAARDRARDLMADLPEAVERFVALVRELRAAHGEVERGVHFESYGVRDGLITRPTVMPGIGLDADVAVLALRAARELVKLSPTDLKLAEIKAAQRSL